MRRFNIYYYLPLKYHAYFIAVLRNDPMQYLIQYYPLYRKQHNSPQNSEGSANVLDQDICLTHSRSMFKQ